MATIQGLGFVCLCSLALVGDIILLFSFSSNITSDIIGLISAFLLAVVFALVIKSIADLFFKRKLKNIKIPGILLSAILCLLLITIALFTVMNFSEFAGEVMLSSRSVAVPFVTVSALAVYIALCGKNTVNKISLLLFPVAVLSVVLIFAFSVQFMSVKYLIPYKMPETGQAFSVFLPVFLNLVATAVPIAVISKGVKKRHVAVSYLFGVLLLAFCAVCPLAIFGSELASTIYYPYSKAVSTASMGHIFSRMDGFLYAVCFFSALMKTALCIRATILIFKNSFKRIFS